MFTKRSLFLKKHARRVLIFKHALPVFAFLLTGLIIVWPLLTPEKERFDLPIQKSDIKTPSVDMENVRFHAQDDKNRTVTVTAESVKEIQPEGQVARLEKPIGVYTLADGDILTNKTTYGLAYQTDKYFLFNQPITTTSKSGYIAHSQHVKATYDGVLDSDYPVDIKGPAGTLNAHGMHLEDKGNLIDFKGKTNSKINLKQGKMTVRTADGLYINRVHKTVTGKKNVYIKHEENTLTADKVILYYTEDKNNRIQRIDAMGHVVLDNGKNKITGDQGTYNPLTEVMEMTGNVRLYQGKSFVVGEKATLNMKTGESHLLTKEQKGRIKGTLDPTDLKDRK
ncbi:MAG: hypothetical protein II938_02870 [Alphaproteobacteria bacterium]|nr:hypothetical protein [Alphaproteobacteria bacterium]